MSGAQGRKEFQACRTGVAAALVGLLCAAHASAEEAAAPGCAIPPAELESAGAVIRHVTVDNQNIFDTSSPEEDKALFRLLNRAHVRTRPLVIERQLLFAEGEPFRAQALEESGRLLRGTPYLYDAQLELVYCDAEVVDVRVRTRDVWTLKPGVSFSRSGGESRVGLDLQDENFLGWGSSVRYKRRIDEDRTSSELGFIDANLGGRWIAVDATVADNSDGHEFALSVARPFYALDTRFAVGGQLLDRKQDEKVYALGDEIGKFSSDVSYAEFFAGRSAGLVDGWVHRWLAGMVYDDRRFANVLDSLDPALVPEDRKLVYPFVEYQLLEDQYLRAENLDQIYRTEDVRLGAEVRIRLGLFDSFMGADRSGVRFSAAASRGYGNPAHALWDFVAYADGRIEGSELRNALFGGVARWYRRQSDRRLLFIGLRADAGEALDLDNPLEIGGDNGLRGYPLRYQRGERRAQFTIEQRYFTDYYLWRLLRVGGAVFFDAGRVWGEDPYGSENLGLLRDVGFGLRLSSTRSSVGRMVHIDVAFPLDGDDSIDSVQFLFEAKRTF